MAVKGYVLVDALTGEVDRVLESFASHPLVKARHHVHYGHFEILLELEGADPASITSFIVNLRFRKGIEMIRQVSAEEVPAILASEEAAAP
jgi:hypothetical protein